MSATVGITLGPSAVLVVDVSFKTGYWCIYNQVVMPDLARKYIYRPEGYFSSGIAKLGIAGELYLYDPWGHEWFLLRSWEKYSGNAFFGLKNGSYAITTTWQRIPKALPAAGQTHIWFGVAGKAGGELGAGGELSVGAMVSIDNTRNYFVFRMLAARCGIAAGGGAGLSLALATGLPDPKALEAEVVCGWDYAISLGAKWGAVCKSLEGVKNLDDLTDAAAFLSKNGDTCVTLAKGIVGASYIDWQETSLSLFDVPVLGAGTEVGIYGYIGGCTILTSGTL